MIFNFDNWQLVVCSLPDFYLDILPEISTLDIVGGVTPPTPPPPVATALVSLAKWPLFNHIYVAFTSFPLGFTDTCMHGVPIFQKSIKMVDKIKILTSLMSLFQPIKFVVAKSYFRYCNCIVLIIVLIAKL